MTATAISLEQFLAQPETEPASEFACGGVVQKPMPTFMMSEGLRCFSTDCVGDSWVEVFIVCFVFDETKQPIAQPKPLNIG